jgi:NADH-quinone oxidoreductase subunit G
MCDQGRLTYKPLNADRVLLAREKQGAAARTLPRAEAAQSAADELLLRANAGTLGVLVSPHASLEDLLVAATVAKEGLGARELFVGGHADGWQDDFLKRADENPNRKGVELVAAALGLALRPAADLAAAVERGAVKAVWAVGTELPDVALAERIAAAEVLVVQARNDGPLARAATLLLPAATHAESDGTFVNFEGRAQRFELAWFPRGDARPHWALAAEIGKALRLRLTFATARDVFLALAPRLGGALGDYSFDQAPSLTRRPGLVPLAAGTVDGRLPGYRERVPEETSEDYRRALARAQEGRP